MMLTQKIIEKTTKRICKNFIDTAYQERERFEDFQAYCNYVQNNCEMFKNQIYGIQLLVPIGSKQESICKSAYESINNQFQLALHQYRQDFSTYTITEGKPGSVKTKTKINHLALSLLLEEPNPKQESYEADVQIAESIINCNDSNCAIKTSCPDCSTSLLGGH